MNITKSSSASFRSATQTWKIGPDYCFLCGASLAKSGATSEHIFPKWLQNRFDLWDQRLTLLNQTSLPYRYLVIPCCEDCNKYRLQPIESIMATYSQLGVTALRGLESKIVYLWLAKIMYGLLYKESLLKHDLKVEDNRTIVAESEIRSNINLLHYLQEVRKKVELQNFCPASILIFRAQTPSNPRLQWDFTDNLDVGFMGMRLGENAIFAIIDDGGIFDLHKDTFEKYSELPLHPLQFRELCAIFAYQASLQIRTPKRITTQTIGEPENIFQLPLNGFSLKPFYGEWDYDKYVHFLSWYTGIAYSDLRPDRSHFRSFLDGPDGFPLYVPIIERDGQVLNWNMENLE